MRVWAAVLLLAIPAAAATVKGERLRFHFEASPVANLTFQLDAMAGHSAADGEAYKRLWNQELRWTGEDERQLDRWRGLRRRHQSGGSPRRKQEPVPWPPNYASFYGAEFSVDQRVRIAGFQARSVNDLRKRLALVIDEEEADGLASVAKHFWGRFSEFWKREGKRLTQPKAEGFARLAKERGVLPLAERLAAFCGARLPERHDVYFYLVAHPTRYGKSTIATQIEEHAPVELLDAETPRERLAVIVHELVHHFYDAAPTERHRALIDEFRAQKGPEWRMAAYSYLNEAVATAAQILVEKRMRTPEAFDRWVRNPRNVYSQPWVAAVGTAAFPVLERCLAGECTLFSGFAPRYLKAVAAGLGERAAHPHFLLASRVLVMSDARLTAAGRLFRERVPSIMHANGWENLERFPEVPVVVLTLDGEEQETMRRVDGRQLYRIRGRTAAEVEQAVAAFALARE